MLHAVLVLNNALYRSPPDSGVVSDSTKIFEPNIFPNIAIHKFNTARPRRHVNRSHTAAELPPSFYSFRSRRDAVGTPLCEGGGVMER